MARTIGTITNYDGDEQPLEPTRERPERLSLTVGRVVRDAGDEVDAVLHELEQRGHGLDCRRERDIDEVRDLSQRIEDPLVHVLPAQPEGEQLLARRAPVLVCLGEEERRFAEDQGAVSSLRAGLAGLPAKGAPSVLNQNEQPLGTPRQRRRLHGRQRAGAECLPPEEHARSYGERPLMSRPRVRSRPAKQRSRPSQTEITALDPLSGPPRALFEPPQEGPRRHLDLSFGGGGHAGREPERATAREITTK